MKKIRRFFGRLHCTMEGHKFLMDVKNEQKEIVNKKCFRCGKLKDVK